MTINMNDVTEGFAMIMSDRKLSLGLKGEQV